MIKKNVRYAAMAALITFPAVTGWAAEPETVTESNTAAASAFSMEAPTTTRYVAPASSILANTTASGNRSDTQSNPAETIQSASTTVLTTFDEEDNTDRSIGASSATADQAADMGISYSRPIGSTVGANGDETIRIVRRGMPTPLPPDPNKLPVKIQADEMYYGDISGDVWAQGKVDVYQGVKELHTARIEGNAKTQEYHTVGAYRYLENRGKTQDLRGTNLSYNTANGHLVTNNVNGWNDPYYIKGEEAVFNGTTGFIKHGWATTKNAMAFIHTPDYRVEGDDIEVYPGDKAIIHNARFYIKNTKILTLSSYTTSLRHSDGFSIFSFMPRPIYSSHNGFGLRNNIVYPIGAHGELYNTNYWYTKEGFKPSYGYRQYMSWGGASVGYSNEEGSLNNQTVWIKKRPEFRVWMNTRHFGSSPITYRTEANIGYWEEGRIKGSHNMIKGEISHDPIKVTSKGRLRFLGGYQRDYYGYNEYTRSMPYFGGNFSWRFNKQFNAWAGYLNQKNSNKSPYPFDRDNNTEKFYTGMSWKATRLDTFSVSFVQNMKTHEWTDVNYTYHRDLHSFDAWITYKSKQDEWDIMVTAKDF